MNLAVLRSSRRAPRVGDIFVMLPPDGRFLFGRVISTDARPLRVGGGLLLYIYRVRSDGKIPPSELRTSELLLPPLMTNRQPWIRGYFENVENRPVRAEDLLSVHCFKDTRGYYFDESGTPLERESTPVGRWGLQSFRTIDDAVSDALGIARSKGE